MSWLRFDDRALLHPKIRVLSDHHFRVWMRMLSACSQHDDPTVDKHVMAEVTDLGPATCKLFHELGLLDQNPHGYTVHNWVKYRPKDPTAADRMSRHRRNNDRNENVTDTVTPRARAKDLPVPPRPEDLEVQALATNAEPLTSPSRESLLSTLTQPIETDDRFDPVTALLHALPDADQGTETVLRAFRLPEYAYRQALEEVQTQHAGVRLAVAILKRIEHERATAPNEPDHRPYDKPTDPAATITRLIANGVITDQVTLEVEIEALGVNGDQADQLRARMTTDPPTPPEPT